MAQFSCRSCGKVSECINENQVAWINLIVKELCGDCFEAWSRKKCLTCGVTLTEGEDVLHESTCNECDISAKYSEMHGE